MPTVLNAGTTQLSNADVLQWIRKKRAQHKLEDNEDKAAGRQPSKRPHKYMNSLRKHERELSNAQYPYASNPGAYSGKNRHESINTLVQAYDEAITIPLEESFKARSDIPIDRLKALISREFDKRTLTPTELLMIQNLAPENVSMLELMIEGWDQRFTSAEMEKLIEVIQAVFRCGEKLPDVAEAT